MMPEPIAPYHERLPDLDRELTERGSLGVLVLDASPLAAIEDEYGTPAYEEVRQRFFKILEESRGKDYRQGDILGFDRPRGVRFLFLLERKRRRNVPLSVADLRALSPEAVALVPKKLAQRFKVFPCRVRGKTLFLGMVDPGDHAAVAHVGYSLGYIVRPMVVPEFRMVQLLRDHYGIDERWRFTDTRGTAPAVPEVKDPAGAAERIDAATTRDEVVAAVLALGRCYFRRVVFFIVREPWVLGWDGAGESMDRSRAAALRVPLDLPSVFQGVTRNRTMFVGRPGPEEANLAFLEAIGKKAGTTAAVFPVAVRGRVVNLMWGDSGSAGAARADLGQLLAFMQKIPRAYLRIIRIRVAESRKQTGPEPGENDEE